jgi:hypothetical protein
VYLLESVILKVECLTQSNTEFFLLEGVSQNNVSPTCYTVLPKHMIISDLSKKPEMDLNHYKWVPDQTTLPNTSRAKIDSAIQFLTKRKADYHTMFWWS